MDNVDLLQDLHDVDRDALLRELSITYKKIETEDPVSVFPAHERQSWVIEQLDECVERDLAIRIVLSLGGNRGGKSALGKCVFSRVMLRQHRINRQLMTLSRFTRQPVPKKDTDPLTVWVIAPTGEKLLTDWVEPADGMGLQYWLGDRFVRHKKDKNIIYARPPGMSAERAKNLMQQDSEESLSALDRIVLKTHDQGIETFESSSVDFGLVDEELLDKSKWNSLMLRIGTTNGAVMMCFTPLNGFSWTYEDFWKPYVEAKFAKEIADRRWVGRRGLRAAIVITQFGAADNPLMKDYAQEIAEDPGMTKAEKDARLYGKYGYVTGALVPLLSGIDMIAPDERHRIYIVDRLPPAHEQAAWYTIADPNKSWGAIGAVADYKGNVFVVWWHLRVAWPDSDHVKAMQRFERMYAPPGATFYRYADPGAAGSQSIVNMASMNMHFFPIERGHGSISASIKKLRTYTAIDKLRIHPITGQPGSPRIFFYRPGMIQKEFTRNGETTLVCRLAEQISAARQTDDEEAPPDTPAKTTKNRLDLFDCLRYLCWMHKVEHTPHRMPGVELTQHNRLPSNRTLSNDSTYEGYSKGFYLPDYGLDA